ncbi:DUF981 family protein [Micromonospora sp. CA-263727]|uniref:DUF981 family protein n=1 Tax=Micromonospora sp. CA-263727 TaxID=3239967 RepID=UPI003D9260B1
MILYNTSLGVAAGVAMITTVRFWAKVRDAGVPAVIRRRPTDYNARAEVGVIDRKRETDLDAADIAPTFFALGIILTGLGGAMTLTHPLTASPPVNIIFGEPCLWLGVLLLASCFQLSCLGGFSIGAIKAASPMVFALGLILAACSAAILRFTLIGAAPAEEPITGLLSDYPVIENTFFVLLYALSAAGALAFPWLTLRGADVAWVAVRWSWSIAGWGFLVFSALNFYTHVGLMVNLSRPGANFSF